MKMYHIEVQGGDDVTSVHLSLTPIELAAIDQLARVVTSAAGEYGPSMEVWEVSECSTDLLSSKWCKIKDSHSAQ